MKLNARWAVPVYLVLKDHLLKNVRTHLKKKHSRTSPELQFKELNEKLRSTLPDLQIN